MLRLLPILFLLLSIPAAAEVPEPEPVTPAMIVDASRAEEWVRIAPADLLVMQLAPAPDGAARAIVIQLMPPPFSEPWVANVRALARAHWWDGTSVYRVVDNWVAQWGGGEGEGFQARALPAQISSPDADYATDAASPKIAAARQSSGRAMDDILREMRGQTPAGNPSPVPGRDAYAERTLFVDGWPVAANLSEGLAWPVHCYGSVGVARDLAPDTGSGSELYAVIGHAPRQLDRNIAVVGRVIEGIEHLSILKRGTGEAGVYATRAEDTPILSVRLAGELPQGEQPAFEYLDSSSASFARYVTVRANRMDAFYTVPAGGVDVCNVQPPVRLSAHGG